jgi:myo-inositol-1(or 4)-monophosphatase
MDRKNVYLELCEKASEAAIEAIGSLVGTPEAYREVYTGADGTPTWLIDDVSEQAILGVLEDSGIKMRILSEEIGECIFGEEPEITVALDPLDGTYNAAMGIPFYSISIAIGSADLSRMDFGYVRNLVSDDTYHAIAGEGAFFNGERIHVSEREKLGEACVSIYGYRTNVEHTLELARRVRRNRLLGSAALELCYVAAGKFDAFADIRNSLRLIDIAAGKLILEEAGGKVTDGTGNKLFPECNVINRLSMIASNGYIHEDILGCVRGGKDESQ